MMTNYDWFKTLSPGDLAQCLEWNGNDAYMTYDEWYEWLNAEYDPEKPGWKWLEEYRESNGNYEVAKIVRCANCVEWNTSWTPNYDLSGDIHYCPIIDQMTRGNFYCADGEKNEV